MAARDATSEKTAIGLQVYFGVKNPEVSHATALKTEFWQL